MWQGSPGGPQLLLLLLFQVLLALLVASFYLYLCLGVLMDLVHAGPVLVMLAGCVRL